MNLASRTLQPDMNIVVQDGVNAIVRNAHQMPNDGVWGSISVPTTLTVGD